MHVVTFSAVWQETYLISTGLIKLGLSVGFLLLSSGAGLLFLGSSDLLGLGVSGGLRSESVKSVSWA
jgi:hypothetical protein